MTREEKIICKIYLNDVDKTHSCNEYKLLMALLEQEPCGDCINRAEAQKHIYKRLYETALNNVGYKCDASDIFTNIAENRLRTWISEIPPIPSKPKAEWFSISERLPEESFNSVIGWDAYRERPVFVQYLDGHFCNMGSNESFNIRAWMPLPEPYKAESEDKE